MKSFNEVLCQYMVYKTWTVHGEQITEIWDLHKVEVSMPFKELCTMNAREKFVLEKLESKKSMTELCKEYGIARNTGYKWVERYKKEGFAGLADRSRAPKRSPLKTDAEIALEVVRIRNIHKYGAAKIHAILKRELGNKTPCVRTISRILEAAGMVSLQKRRKKVRILAQKPKIEFEKPNDLWTIDFKGWWVSKGEKIEPLTIRDAMSRMILECEAVKNCSFATVKAVMEKVFRKYGIPKVILTDNGPPFVANFNKGITRITAWWASLGIEHIKSRPGKPCDNGAHERMHRDIAEQVEPLKHLSKEQCQVELKRFMHNFNFHRPHQALGQKMPSDVYKSSPVKYNDKPVLFTYPKHFIRLNVSSMGRVSMLTQRVYISESLTGLEIGLEYNSKMGYYALYLGKVQLGFIFKNHEKKLKFEISFDLQAYPHGGSMTG